MALKLPSLRRISREDLTDAPAWIDRLILPINSFMESVYDAFNTILNSEMVKEFDIPSASATPASNTFSFSHSLKYTPTGLELMQVTLVGNVVTPITSAVFISWHVSGSNQIAIDAIVGLTAGKKYHFRVRVT